VSGRGSLLSGASLFEVAPAHIDVGDRIGFLHEDKAAALGRLMAVDGQRDPIKLVANPKNPDKPWKLVVGMHRTIGAQLEDIKLWALEVSGKPEDLADLRRRRTCIAARWRRSNGRSSRPRWCRRRRSGSPASMAG